MYLLQKLELFRTGYFSIYENIIPFSSYIALQPNKYPCEQLIVAPQQLNIILNPCHLAWTAKSDPRFEASSLFGAFYERRLTAFGAIFFVIHRLDPFSVSTISKGSYGSCFFFDLIGFITCLRFTFPTCLDWIYFRLFMMPFGGGFLKMVGFTVGVKLGVVTDGSIKHFIFIAVLFIFLLVL